MPVAKYKSSRAKWRAIAKISLLSRGFVPNYPNEIPINPRMFIEVFPYHVIFDPSMKVHQSGISIQQLMPSIRNRSSDMEDYFTLLYPRCTDLTYLNVQRFIRSPFILEMRREKMQKTWTKRPPLLIKGACLFFLRIFVIQILKHLWLGNICFIWFCVVFLQGKCFIWGITAPSFSWRHLISGLGRT